MWKRNTPKMENPKRRATAEYLEKVGFIPFTLQEKRKQIELWRALGYTPEQIKPLEAECETFKTEYAKVNDLLTKIEPRFKQILELRYMNGLTIHKVAEISGYHHRWVQRLIVDALDEFAKYVI